jgi:hypothetical protein
MRIGGYEQLLVIGTCHRMMRHANDSLNPEPCGHCHRRREQSKLAIDRLLAQKLL